jgi:hypothetical protein
MTECDWSERFAERNSWDLEKELDAGAKFRWNTTGLEVWKIVEHDL